MKLKWLLLILLIACPAVPVSAEYYQYKDEEGTLRFSDTAPEIENEQQADVVNYESFQSPDSQGYSTRKDFSAPVETDASDSWDGRLESTVGELEQMEKEIAKTFDEIMAERKSIAIDPPAENATSGERSDYNYRARALNKKIEAYDQLVQDYDRQSKAYNSGIKKKK